LKKRQLLIGLIVLAALAALIFWGVRRSHFSFAVFGKQVAVADWRTIALATGCIYAGYVFRAVRWARLMRHNKKVPLFSLLSCQVIGFTAVALIGRVADLVRPYLVAKKTALPLSTQFAVYIVERLCDFGSLALIISFAIVLAPHGALPDPQIVRKAGYGGLAITVLAGLFLFAVRLAGGAVASFFERALGMASKKLGETAGQKIRSFRTGLDTIRSASDFGAAAALSLSMWALITLAYLETMRSFTASPVLVHMDLSGCILLLAVSGSVSVFQLPILGWFSQIAFVAAAIVTLFSATPEAATACAAMLLLVTFLSIAPTGLIWAHFERVSLRKITLESEHAGHDLAPANYQ
jgi:hypothetical protein